MNAPRMPVTAPPLWRRAEALGTENAFVVLAEVNALVSAWRDGILACLMLPRPRIGKKRALPPGCRLDRA